MRRICAQDYRWSSRRRYRIGRVEWVDGTGGLGGRREPAGGTHPDARAACLDLIKVGADIAAIPSEQPPVGCPGIRFPVVASATGTWAGHTETYRMEFSNGCQAKATTGGRVFHFGPGR